MFPESYKLCLEKKLFPYSDNENNKSYTFVSQKFPSYDAR